MRRAGVAGRARCWSPSRRRGRRRLPADDARRRRGRGDVPGLRHAARPRERGAAGPARARLHRAPDRAVQVEGRDQARAGGASSATACSPCRATRATTSLGDVLVYVVPALGIAARARPGSRSPRPAGGARGGRPPARRCAAAADGARARGRHGALRPVIADRAASTPPSSPPSRSASSRSSRPACCRSCPATCRPSRASRSPTSRRARGRAQVLGPALLFCLSFTVMFVALGMTATGLGQTLQDHRALLRQISGVVLIARWACCSSRRCSCPLLNREWRPEELMRARPHRRADRRRARVRGRLAAVHRPHARRDPHRGLAARTPSARAACCSPSTRSAWRCRSSSARSRSRPSPGSSASSATTTRVITLVSGVDPDRDGRAALHERAHAAELRGARAMDDLGLNFFSEL